jgi:putative ABC transport system permease protein
MADSFPPVESAQAAERVERRGERAMVQELFQDLRYAARLLLNTPAFSAVAIVTLALGIGANTAIFTIVRGVLLRPLPYAHPEHLVTVWQDVTARGGPADEWATPGNYADWRREKALFEELAVITGWRPTLTGGAEPESIAGEQVSHEYFSVLGVAPALGRTFTQQDDVPNAARVAIISDELWRRRFGGSPSAVGQRVALGAEPHEIIGVLPPGFRPIVSPGAEIWRPLRLNMANPSRGSVVLRTIARLPAGLTLERAQTAAGVLARQLEAAYPESNEKTGILIVPLHERVVGDIKPGLLTLLGAVAFVLLIACANIANLLLARGSARGREVAVRVALGAARGRVIRQLLTESVLLAVIGGLAGVTLTVWAVDAMVAIAPQSAPRVNEVRLDGMVLGFAAFLTLVTGMLFGLAPALHSSRRDVSSSLKDGARGGTMAGGRALRRALIAAEVALALLLLTGGGLLLQTFVKLQSADLGFDPQNVLVGFVNPPRAAGYDTPAKHRAFYDLVFEKAKTLPGVQKAAMASVLPLSGDSDMSFVIEGRPEPRLPSETPVTWYRLVSATYFDTMGIALRRGHGFEESERAPSIVVNETFARTYFPADEPLGKRVRFGSQGEDPWFTIVGIAADVKVRGARESARVETFIPYWQFTEPGMVVILKASGSPVRLAGPLRQAVATVDRNVPVSGITTLTEMVGDSIDQPRFLAALALAFAMMALVLAGIGIYGVMAYSVSQRTAEIGVRMALGATRRDVFRLVVGDGLRLAAAGVLIGSAGSLLVAQSLRSMLFGVRPGDPATLAVTAAALVSVAALACVIPARRATRVDPIVALRAE